MHLYALAGAGMRFGENVVLKNVNLTFSSGEFVAVAGPNGAGKSTLLGIMAGLRDGYSGSCRFNDREIGAWSRRAFAQQVSVVPQSVRIDFGFTAEQIVLMGRAPFSDTLFESERDADQVRQAMDLTGTLEFRDRDIRTLSGGERQRVIVAAALAQSPHVLLLDEPTAFLDIEHQISLYRLLRKLAHDGVLVVSVTHDLNLAAQFADRIVLLRGGESLADGTPDAVLNEATIRSVFHVDAHIVSEGGRRWIHYGP